MAYGDKWIKQTVTGELGIQGQEDKTHRDRRVRHAERREVTP